MMLEVFVFVVSEDSDINVQSKIQKPRIMAFIMMLIFQEEIIPERKSNDKSAYMNPINIMLSRRNKTRSQAERRIRTLAIG